MHVDLQAAPKVELVTRPVLDTAKVVAAKTTQKQVLDPKVGNVFGRRAAGITTSQ